jgi:hypothetical protein
MMMGFSSGHTDMVNLSTALRFRIRTKRPPRPGPILVETDVSASVILASDLLLKASIELDYYQ